MVLMEKPVKSKGANVHQDDYVDCCKSREIQKNTEDIIEIRTILRYQDKQVGELIAKMDSLVSRIDELVVAEAEIRSSRQSSIDMVEWIIPVFLTIVTIILSRVLHL